MIQSSGLIGTNRIEPLEGGRDNKILRGAFKGAILHLYEEHFAEIIKQYKSEIGDLRRKME